LRRLMKALSNLTGLIAALPFIAWAGLPLRLFGSERSYSSAACALAIIPGLPGLVMRRAFYHSLLPESHWDLHLDFGSIITHPTARIGKRVWIGAYSLIGHCRIGDDAIIGSRVSILSGRYPHRFSSVERCIAEQPGVFQEVSIGADCWLGEGSVVMADVGQGCVVGAGSVVAKPTADLSVVAGNPARQIGARGGKQVEVASG